MTMSHGTVAGQQVVFWPGGVGVLGKAPGQRWLMVEIDSQPRFGSMP
jgi:hypothetical protein